MHPGGPPPELRRGADRDASSPDERPSLESEAAFRRSLRLGRGAASEHVPAGPLSVSEAGPGDLHFSPSPSLSSELEYVWNTEQAEG